MTELEIFKLSPSARKFRSKFKNFNDFWNACPKVDWIFHIAYQVGVDEKIIFRAKGICGMKVIHLMSDDRSIKAVKSTIDYVDGLISSDELENYHKQAYEAAYESGYDYDYFAAYTSSKTAYYIYDYTAEYNKTNEKQMADICRDVLREEVERRLL